MVTLSDISGLIGPASNAVNNQVGSIASFLDNKIGSKGLGNSGLGAQDLFNLAQNPNPQNILNTVRNMPAVSSLPFANNINTAMNFLQNPSAENIIKTGAQAALTPAVTTAATALLGPFGIAAAPVVGAVVGGAMNLVGDLLGGIGKPPISAEDEAAIKNLVFDKLDPSQLSEFSTRQLADVCENITNNPNILPDKKRAYLNAIASRINDIADAMPPGPQKDATVKLFKDIRESFSNTGGLFNRVTTDDKTSGKVQTAFSDYYNSLNSGTC
jgi:hypothetical protein